MADSIDRRIDIATITDILIKCNTYDVNLRKSDKQVLDGIINMHAPAYKSARRKVKARECADCVLSVFRLCVNLNGRAKKDIKTLVGYLVFLTTDVSTPSADEDRLEAKIDKIIKKYKAEEEKALADKASAKISALGYNVNVVKKYVDENIELLKTLEQEERANKSSDFDAINNMEAARRFLENIRPRLAEIALMDGIYAPVVSSRLDKIAKLVLQVRDDIYHGRYIANLAMDSKDSKFKAIDAELKDIEGASLPKGKVTQTYADHLVYEKDKEYEIFVDYPRRKQEYLEARKSIENERSRVYKIINEAVQSVDELERQKADLQQQILTLKKQNKNGEITPAKYSVQASLLKSKWDNCLRAIQITGSNTLNIMQSILSNLNACSDVFATIDSFVQLASRNEFMSFIDRILKSIHSILAVLGRTNPGETDIERIKAVVEDLNGLQAEDAFNSVLLRRQVDEVTAPMLKNEPAADPLGDLDFDEEPEVAPVRTEKKPVAETANPVARVKND